MAPGKREQASVNKRSLFVLFSCLLPIAYCLLFLLPHVADAQQTNAGGFVPLAETSGGKLGNLYSQQQSGTLVGFVNGLFKFALALGAIGAVLRLAYAGYLYMGQSDMWSHKGEARAVISDVTLGLLLLLSIYLILYQINPDILQLNALKNITPVQSAQGPCPGTGNPVNANGGC